MAIDPDPSPWHFPPVSTASEEGILGVGADLAAGTILAAYERGIFPMPLNDGGPIAWWSPDPRGVLRLENLRVSRSLRRSCHRFDVRVNTQFEAVITACADRSRSHGWIDQRILDAYIDLHRGGWAHSVETWLDDELVGGLYGVAIGGLFAGESMFHRATDASKVALVGLADLLDDGHPRLIDVQWSTPHLETLGATPIARSDYLAELDRIRMSPLPAAFRHP